MVSDTNKTSEPALCANGCGFFGSMSTINLCSKCFHERRIKDEQAKAAMAEKLVNKFVSFRAMMMPDVSSQPTNRNRCLSCKKKVGVMGFKCKCGETFCGSHRYPEVHDCGLDFKTSGRDAIAKANPVIKADKLNRI